MVIEEGIVDLKDASIDIRGEMDRGRESCGIPTTGDGEIKAGVSRRNESRPVMMKSRNELFKDGGIKCIICNETNARLLGEGFVLGINTVVLALILYTRRRISLPTQPNDIRSVRGTLLE